MCVIKKIGVIIFYNLTSEKNDKPDGLRNEESVRGPVEEGNVGSK